MTARDAYMFPVYASASLFTLYLIFKASRRPLCACHQRALNNTLPAYNAQQFFGKEYINMLLGGYFFLLGVSSLVETMSPLLHRVVPKFLWGRPYHLLLTQGALLACPVVGHPHTFLSHIVILRSASVRRRGCTACAKDHHRRACQGGLRPGEYVYCERPAGWLPTRRALLAGRSDCGLAV
jgi:hypothetical protein